MAGRAALAALAFTGLVASAGCSPRVDAGAQDELDLTRLRNQMCQCLDPACAQRALAAMRAWQAEVARRGGEPTATQNARDLQAGFEACHATVRQRFTPAEAPPPAAGAR